MAHIRKGQLTATKEWAAHLRPYWKRQFWGQERVAEREDINQQLRENFVDNQHKLIKGYRDLSQAEIDLMNEGKALAEQVGAWIAKLETTRPGTADSDVNPFDLLPDKRWLAIGKTHLQQGFMAAIRAIAKPTTF